MMDSDLVSLGSPRSLLSKGTVVISTRRGQVLSRDTILKDDHLVGDINGDLEPRICDVPNFRRVKLDGIEIYASAQASAPGTAAVLTILGSGPILSYGGGGGAAGAGAAPQQKKTVWINTREEPLVYLNGKPFTLREQEFPLRNMKRYTGVDAVRVEQMEARLKTDIIREAAGYGGLLLVHEEQGLCTSLLSHPPFNPPLSDDPLF